jgi:hypothetical protein
MSAAARILAIVTGKGDATVALSDFLRECSRAEELFREDKLHESHALVETLERSLEKAVEAGEDAEAATCVLSDYGTLFGKVKHEFGLLRTLLEYAGHSEDDWTLARDDGGVQTHFRQGEEGLVTVRLSGVIEASVVNFVAVMQENDLWPEWIPRLSHASTHKAVSRFHKVVFVRVNGMGPVAARYLYLDGRGYDLLATAGAIVILARNAEDVEAAAPVKESDVMLRLLAGGAILLPVAPDVTQVVLLGRADPALPVIPFWLLNMVTKQLAHQAFEVMRERSAQLPPVYAERIAQNPAVYAEVRRRMDDFLGKAN